MISLIGILTACSGSAELETRLKSCRATRSYPAARYIRAAAEGEGLKLARDRARAEIAHSLSAELSSEVIVRAESDNERGTRAQVSERIAVESRFEHAELIKPIKRCEVCRGVRCVSWVALSRDEAARRLLQGVGAHEQRFHKAIRDLNSATPLLRFAQAWRQAQATYAHLVPIINQLKLLGRSSPSLLRVEEEMERANKARARRERRLWIRIAPLELARVVGVPNTEPSTLHETVDAQFSKALSHLKLKRWGGKACPSIKTQEDVKIQEDVKTQEDVTPPEVITLTPYGALNCKLGLIGPQCELELSIALELCTPRGSTALAQASWHELKLVGVHPRHAQIALSHLSRSVGQVDLSPSLESALSPFVLF